MQVQHPELDQAFDQGNGLVRELPLVRHVREDHADRELPAEGHLRRDVYEHDVLDTEDHAVSEREPDAQLVHAHVSVDRVGEPVLPHASSVRLASKELDALHAAHGLHEERLFPGVVDDGVLAPGAQRRIGNDAQNQV